MILCLCSFGVPTHTVSGIPSLPLSHERRLVTDLLTRYRAYGKEARPLFNSSQVLTVQLGLRLVHLELDEKEQTMVTSVWKRVVSN